MTRAPFAIIGVGNVLMGDDGFGPATLRRLETGWRFPEEVELCDVGTAGLDLTGALLGRRRVLLLDAARAAGEPGALVRWDREALLAARGAGPRLTPHEPGVRDAMQVAALAGQLPDEAMLLGCVPLAMEIGVELTDVVAAAVERAAREVVAVARTWGCTVEPTGNAPDCAWWRPLVA